MSVQQCLKKYLELMQEAPEEVNVNAGLRLYAHLLVKGGSDTIKYRRAMEIAGITNYKRYYRLKNWMVEVKLIKCEGDEIEIAVPRLPETKFGTRRSESPLPETTLGTRRFESGTGKESGSETPSSHSESPLRFDGQQVSLVPEFDREVKARYNKLDKAVPGAIQKFIQDERPDFIEPYMDAWNKWAVRFKNPQLKNITTARKVKFKQRLSEKNFDFIELMRMATRSPMLQGASWFTFDWLFHSEQNYTKLAEGNYMQSLKEAAPQQQKTEDYNPGDKRLEDLLNKTAKNLQ